MADTVFLQTDVRPNYEMTDSEPRIRIVDLFCGGGGLTLGAAEAARRQGFATDVVLAAEWDESVADVYLQNFPKATVEKRDVSSLFDGRLGSKPTPVERKTMLRVGAVDFLLAGPPCQGHSDLNNHTRRTDPRNALYLRAVRAAEVLRPPFVVIENVPAVIHDKEDVIGVATTALERAGYTVASRVLDLVRLGVPQRRRRHILLAVGNGVIDPTVMLDIRSSCDSHEERSVRWAIEDLWEIEPRTGTDTFSSPTKENKKRMQWLIENGKYDLPNKMRPPCHSDKEHKYNSMYGRLYWDRPAPTITTGFGSMGQGRFVHPAQARTITPHEAARLQTLPDFFSLGTAGYRNAWAKIIGNAVPPLLGVHLLDPLLCTMPKVDQPMPSAFSTEGDLIDIVPSEKRGNPSASSEVTQQRMSTQRQHNTKPEMKIRSELHRLGLRFRTSAKVPGQRGKVDVVFPTERVAVYIDGCFWHGCPEHGTVPKQNTQWWVEKLNANQARDTAITEEFVADGWCVLRFWEHDDPVVAARTVYKKVLERQKAGIGRTRQ